MPITGTATVSPSRRAIACGAASWSAYAWVRNAFDQRYPVRGFFFGDEPPDFPEKLYVRLGDPRQAGVTASFSF